MSSSARRRVPRRLPLELLPSLHQALSLASVHPEDLGFGPDLDAVARRAAERARVLSWGDGAIVEIADEDGIVHRAKVGHGAARRGPTMPDHPWRALIGSAPQVCGDTEADPRVPPDVAPRLGTRSVVVVALRNGD